MSLIDDLRQAAPSIPPSHVPTQHEVAGILGALILHLEHPDEFLDAAGEGHNAVGDLISPPAEPEPDQGAEQAEQIEQLRAQVAALSGASGHPTVTVDHPEDEGV